jgi:glycosyltransferase involved in cell wall biosynthesis
VRLLLWHVHGSWTTAFVQGAHDYFVPVLPGRGPDGRGRAQTWRWPESVREVAPEQMAKLELDAVVLQRPCELELAERWLGRRPGVDLPAVYVEHNAPQGRIAEMRHPLADRPELTLVHVTHFNDLFWDSGTTPTRVIEHGIVDPGYRYTGELPRSAVVINEARRRARVTGTDLLDRLAQAAPIDLFGMDAAGLEGGAGRAGDGLRAARGATGSIGAIDDIPQAALHDRMARRRVYLHPIRWTSLGLSLIEAMHLGMPVVALATTEAPEAVPGQAGVVSTRVDVLADAIKRYVADRERAQAAGQAARAAALRRYGLERFLRDWEELLAEVAP